MQITATILCHDIRRLLMPRGWPRTMFRCHSPELPYHHLYPATCAPVEISCRHGAVDALPSMPHGRPIDAGLLGGLLIRLLPASASFSSIRWRRRRQEPLMRGLAADRGQVFFAGHFTSIWRLGPGPDARQAADAADEDDAGVSLPFRLFYHRQSALSSMPAGLPCPSNLPSSRPRIYG